MSVDLILGHLAMGPLIFAIGYYFSKYPPKEINSLYGYRTNRSMRNKECWDFANNHSSALMLKYALLTTAVQAIGILLVNEKQALLAGAIVLVSTLIISVFQTEQALKKHFDKEGNRL